MRSSDSTVGVCCNPLVLSLCFLILNTCHANAHTSEQAFVLLLPTGVYTSAGVAAVALTVIILVFVPPRLVENLFASKELLPTPTLAISTFTSMLSFGLLAVLVYAGVTGSRDPLGNPLPLIIWTVWWIAFVTLQAIFGDLWRWVNPWTGLYRLVFSGMSGHPSLRLPERVASWPGIAAYFAFAYFLLVDLAPDDPARLAIAVALYWLYTFVGMALFGADDWLDRCECFTMLLRHFARLSALACKSGHVYFGTPGWRIVHASGLTLSGGLFVIFLLGTGSFDGLNETFWWLGLIGVNPLEFPGRSAVVWQTTIGLITANFALALIFAGTISLGLRLARTGTSIRVAFGQLAPAILPIALGYHVAHYLAAFLVQGQYALAAATDPWSDGSDYLSLGPFHVTTGFFNTRDTVEIIWLTQAGAVVLGHIFSVLVSHAIAVRLFQNHRQAVLSQIPLAVFMIAYTFFGLWLLASPRGA